jgi:hypothetical protein
MFIWPCFIVYQCNETKVMHFSFNLLRIKGLYMFRALLADPQEVIHKRHLVYCLHIISVDCATIAVSVRVVPCGEDRRKDMTKLIVAFRNFSDSPKIGCTVAEGISCRSATAEAWVQSQSSLCVSGCGIRCTGTGLSPATSAFPPQYNSASSQ